MTIPWLSIAIFAPLVGAMLTWMVKDRTKSRWVALVTSLVPLAISIRALVDLPGVGEYILTEQVVWAESLGITYTMAVDGLSAPLFALTALLVTTSIVFSWEQEHRASGFYAMLLLMDVSVLGVFAALDLFVFYVFWEFVLIPMFFLIAIWGGDQRKYAAIKFFVYTFLASLVMLLAFMAIYFAVDAGTFNWLELADSTPLLGRNLQILLFLGLFVGFAVKMPLVPVHTWLPWAHVQAPTAGSVLLAGVLLKMGAYGLIRFGFGGFPAAAQFLAPFLLVIAVLSILYGAVVCLAQQDLKRMVAFSSIAHMGVVLLGLATFTKIGFVGAIFMLVAHGLLSPLSFMMCGSIQHGWGTRRIDELGGIMQKTPKMGVFTMIAFIGSLGFPGLAVFISEVTVFIGAYQAFGWFVLIPIVSVVLNAAYFIWAIKRSLHGPLTAKGASQAHDLPVYETVAISVLAGLSILYGVWPALLTDLVNPYVDALFTVLGVR